MPNAKGVCFVDIGHSFKNSSFGSCDTRTPKYGKSILA